MRVAAPARELQCASPNVPILSQVPRMSSERKAMHAGEAVAEALREEGVRAVYSVPGSHIHPIYDGLSRVESIRMVTCKQEPNVSLMADAYGRITGKPGVCLVTAGPGGLNSMAGVAQAYGAASPMVHIGGAVPLKADMEAFHGVDHPAVRARDVPAHHEVERARRAHRRHSRSFRESLPHRAERPARAGPCRASAAERLQRIHSPGHARGRAAVQGDRRRPSQA